MIRPARAAGAIQLRLASQMHTHTSTRGQQLSPVSLHLWPASTCRKCVIRKLLSGIERKEERFFGTTLADPAGVRPNWFMSVDYALSRSVFPRKIQFGRFAELRGFIA